MEKVAWSFLPNAPIFIGMHLGLCVTRGCDPAVVDDPTDQEYTRDGHHMEETRMTRGMTSLAQVVIEIFDKICMY